MNKPVVTIIVVVVIIIAGLAYLSSKKPSAPPPGTEDEIRNKVARTESELRFVAVALETFYVDNKRYPAPDKRDAVPEILTKPVAYITGIPNDPFSGAYRYFVATDAQQWALVGTGPDADFDLDKRTYESLAKTAGKHLWEELQAYRFDPTNGTISRGDIIRTGP